MKCACRIFTAILCVAAVVAVPSTPSAAGCPPLSGGNDVYPSTTKLVVGNGFLGRPFVVRLSSANRLDTIVARDDQVGDVIETEIVQLELAGFHPRIGPVVLRQSPTAPSLGQIRNVVLDDGCALAAGDSFFDIYFELEVPNMGEVWFNQEPVRIEAPLTELPPDGVVFEVPFTHSAPLLERDTLDDRGQLLYAHDHADPPFPPPGRDCFQTLLTADLEVDAASTTVSLIGFGPATVERGPVSTGGYCRQGGGPCENNFDCFLLDTCVQQHVDTEIVAMDLIGFDPVLGSWELHVRPVTGDSDCCEEHAAPGCSDPACEALICTLDSFCCESEWDGLCASLAQGEPACEIGCFDPDAMPSEGRMESVGSAATYPAQSSFDVYLNIESAQQGHFLNQQKIPTQPAQPITNFPPDPDAAYRYLGAGVPMFEENATPVGEVSGVEYELQVPLDCAPPPAAGEECLSSTIRLELELPACPAEIVELDGHVRVMRDDPDDPVGFGSEIIDTTLANALFAGAGSCNGPITLRLASPAASSGTNSSLTPEEFFPADSFFDLFIELETPGGTLDAGQAYLTTTVNALPPDNGEVYFGPATAVDVFDGIGTKIGEIHGLSVTVNGEIVCPSDGRAAIVFPGPGKDEIDVGIPAGGGGVEYDVVRGELSALRSSGGEFDSTTCISTDGGPLPTDGATPPAGDAYFYVARDGFGAFNGTWNGPGPAQVADRDAKIAPCP